MELCPGRWPRCPSFLCPLPSMLFFSSQAFLEVDTIIISSHQKSWHLEKKSRKRFQGRRNDQPMTGSLESPRQTRWWRKERGHAHCLGEWQPHEKVKMNPEISLEEEGDKRSWKEGRTGRILFICFRVFLCYCLNFIFILLSWFLLVNSHIGSQFRKELIY